jgi:anti-sigma regulatory factor (Ser/Thr protein kinase)
MRRNGTNLLVLSGARVDREQDEPVPVATVINAAASEVEEYRRVVIATVPDSALAGSAAGDVVHLLAELIDNALRYSPPTSTVRVSAVHTGNRGVVIEVSDTGLGMTEGDLRMANTRLESGGEVTPYTARHMGLFVVGRLADQHGLVVRLRMSVAGEPRSGTTAGIFVPAELIVDASAHGWSDPYEFDEDFGDGATPDGRTSAAMAGASEDFPGSAAAMHSDAGMFGEPYRNGSSSHADEPASTLPRRNPGASGIVDAPDTTPEPVVSDMPEPEWPAEHDEEPGSTRAPVDTSAFFSSRAYGPNGSSDAFHEEQQPAPDLFSARPPSSPLDDTDVIFQRMLSEWLIDPDTLMQPSQPWESIWDSGWAAAANASEARVDDHTDQGLPVRRPGARLVPGSVEHGGRPNGAAHRKPDDDNGVGSAAGDPSVRRDPDAVRSSLSNHLGGVRAGRSHARETDPETDSQ